jgi:hypothetical protein
MRAPFALLLPVIFVRARRPLMTHVTFAMHLYAFLLLLFSVALLIAGLSELIGSGGLDAPLVDHLLSIANVAACMLYLYVAIAPVYGAMGVVRIVQAVVLSLVVAAIVPGYRFALFFTTL